MLQRLSRSTVRLGRQWKPLDFSNPHFPVIPAHDKIEEETIPGYVAARYYPTKIGEVFRDQYQVVGKLGFGASSTVWLARDMIHKRHAALKVFVDSKAMGQQLNDELNTYKRLDQGSKIHPGRDTVRRLLDHFDIDGPNGQHRCLVHPPLWESLSAFLHRNPIRRLPVPVVAFVLKRLFYAMDYLHTQCKMIHTDIKADNIMLGIDGDDAAFAEFENREIQSPSPRKEVDDGMTIYASRELAMPQNVGAPVLCDFGSAVPGDVEEHLEDIQPDIYRAPEVILEYPWTYSVDIWNVGCMVWDIFEGGHFFSGQDIELETYRSRAHLAEMISLLGPPPQEMLARGQASSKFYSNKGEFIAGTQIPKRVLLERRESNLEAEDKKLFLRLMSKMLQWQPEKRSSARELIEDKWIQKHTQ